MEPLTSQDFQLRTEMFLKWFRSLPGSTFDERLCITDLRNRHAGRGMVAQADIPADTVLFTIPRQAVLSVANSELFNDLPGLFGPENAMGSAKTEDDEEKESNPWTSLILTMIYEYLRGEGSPWKRYFDVLPAEFDTLMFWSEEELSQLQGSTVRTKVGKSEAEDMFHKTVLPALRDHDDVFYPEGTSRLDEVDALALAHRMGSLIMSYSFELDKDEEDENTEEDGDGGQDGWVEDKQSQTLAMLPMADILNSDAEFNAHVDHSGETITVVALRDIRRGDEVLNYYGPLPNSDLLRRYGYVSEKHDRYNVVEIPKLLVATGIQQQLQTVDAFKEKAISYYDEDMDEPVVIERDGGEPNSDGTVTAPVSDDNMLAELEEAVVALLNCFKKTSGAVVPNKRRREELTHTIIPHVLALRIGQYATTFAEDQVLLTRPETTGRLQMAIKVRLGEKLLLQEALYRFSLEGPATRIMQDANACGKVAKKGKIT